MISSSPAQRDFAVRLVNGGNSTGSEQYLGHVEVYVGAPYSLGWSIEDALVVCRMLGFPSASRAVTNGVYGLGTGPVWLSNVNCRGNESSLANCTYTGLNNTGCLHSQDAGLVCSDCECYEGDLRGNEGDLRGNEGDLRGLMRGTLGVMRGTLG